MGDGVEVLNFQHFSVCQLEYKRTWLKKTSPFKFAYIQWQSLTIIFADKIRLWWEYDHHHRRVGVGGWRRVRVIRGNKAKCLPSTNVYHHSLTEYTIVKRKLRTSLETLSTKYERWYFFACEIIAFIPPKLAVSKDLGLWLLKSLSFVIILIWYKKKLTRIYFDLRTRISTWRFKR